MARESYQTLPEGRLDDPYWLSLVVNGAMAGRVNIGGSFTVSASSSGPLTIVDFNTSGQSIVFFCPRNDNAAALLYDSHLHLLAPGKEKFDVTWNGTSPAGDADFDYIVIG